MTLYVPWEGEGGGGREGERALASDALAPALALYM